MERNVAQPMLTFKEAAAWLNIPVSTLHELRRSGRGPEHVQIGKHYRISKIALYVWLQARGSLPTANETESKEQ